VQRASQRRIPLSLCSAVLFELALHRIIIMDGVAAEKLKTQNRMRRGAFNIKASSQLRPSAPAAQRAVI